MRDSRNFPDEGLFRKIGMLVLMFAIMSMILSGILGNIQNVVAEEGDSDERQITGDKDSSSESTSDKSQIVLILVVIIIILLILIIILQFVGDESPKEEDLDDLEDEAPRHHHMRSLHRGIATESASRITVVRGFKLDETRKPDVIEEVKVLRQNAVPSSW